MPETSLNGAARPQAKKQTSPKPKSATTTTTTSKPKETKKMASKASADTGVFSKMSETFKSSTESLKETYGSVFDQQRKVGLQLIEYAEENAKHGFETWRAVLSSENVSDALKIQSEAVRESVERNIGNVRETAEMVTEINRDAFKPVGEMFSKLRNGQAAA